MNEELFTLPSATVLTAQQRLAFARARLGKAQEAYNKAQQSIPDDMPTEVRRELREAYSEVRSIEQEIINP